MLSASRCVFFLACAFILGVLASSLLNVPQWLIGEFFLLGLFYFLWCYKRIAPAMMGLCLVVFSLGMARTQLAQLNGTIETKTAEASVVKDSFKERLYGEMDQRFSVPSADILAGILIGEQKNISWEWKQKMNDSGTRHITAVSGTNVVLLAQMLLILGLAFSLWRQQAIVLSLSAIWGYTFFIGTPDSAVRAAIMGSLLLMAQALGRQNHAGRAIFLAAAVMLAISPLALLSDWGFQLSFLATLGIVYLSSPLKTYLKKRGLPDKGLLNEALVVTLAAQLFTWPWLCYNLGAMSLVAPLSNFMIAPVIPLIMILGFIFLLAAQLSATLAVVLSWPCQLLLNYLLWVINWTAQTPLSHLMLPISWVVMLAGYTILAFLVFKLRKNSLSGDFY